MESKDDLVTVDHLPGSKASQIANLAGEDAVDIKNMFHHIKIHSLYLSTVQKEPFSNINYKIHLHNI